MNSSEYRRRLAAAKARQAGAAPVRPAVSAPQVTSPFKKPTSPLEAPSIPLSGSAEGVAFPENPEERQPVVMPDLLVPGEPMLEEAVVVPVAAETQPQTVEMDTTTMTPPEKADLSNPAPEALSRFLLEYPAPPASDEAARDQWVNQLAEAFLDLTDEDYEACMTYLAATDAVVHQQLVAILTSDNNSDTTGAADTTAAEDTAADTTAAEDAAEEPADEDE